MLQAYERRFPVCPLVPQLLATDVLREEKSDDGAHHTVERRCTIDFEVPYILRKVLIALLHTPTCSIDNIYLRYILSMLVVTPDPHLRSLGRR